jgi:peptidyl-prolyl cis-trans isomerase SurA
MAVIRQKVIDGTPFDDAVRESVPSSEIKDVGYLGSFALNDLAPQILAALEGVKAGDVTDIVDTGQSLQLFYVEAMREGEGKTLEEVSAEIENILYDEIVNQKFMTWLTDLRERSHIRIIR